MLWVVWKDLVCVDVASKESIQISRVWLTLDHDDSNGSNLHEHSFDHVILLDFIYMQHVSNPFNPINVYLASS